MATLGKALIYDGDTHCALSSKVLHVVAAPKDSNYVDLNELLDLKLGETKAVQVSFTGQKDTLQCVRLPSAEHLPSLTRKCANVECWENGKTKGATETKTAGSSEGPQLSHGSLMDCPELLEMRESERTLEILEKETKELDDGDLRRTELYFSEKSESDDEVSTVIADYCVHEMAGDEAHYITTHEIQLSELDHDVDCDLETVSTWDIDDEHQVYSFVDYASVDNNEPKEVQVENIEDEAHRITAVACSQAESDPGDRSATSEEKAPECQSKRTGHIHLSIKATSRAINKPSNVQEKDGGHHRYAIYTEDMSRCVLKDTKGGNVCDGAKCLIALPGRLHFGNKFKGKDVTGYSSGTSSAVSELDDADKEVRNLTARAFKSLAYPYLDAINFSTSSESSASERSKGLNRWSALVDLKYGKVNVSKGGGHNAVAHQNASSNFSLAKRRESKGITGLTLTSRRAPPVEVFALNGNLVNPKNASLTRGNELMGTIGQGQSGVIRLSETLNFRCNVKASPPANEQRVKSARTTGGSHSADEVTNLRQKAHSKPPCDSDDAMEDVHKKSIFASSILKNVISKKMQFEQERKMERGEIIEPCSHEHEAHRDKTALTGLHRQSSKLSETGSDFSIVCLDELGDFVDSGSSDAKDNERLEEHIALASETNLESQNCAAFDAIKGASDASRGALIRSQNSAFRSWKDEELEAQTERKSKQTDSTNSKLTKMSRLFVPSIQLVSGEREIEKTKPSANNNREVRSMNTLYVSGVAQKPGTSKSPEIKISLRSLREDRSDPFSIAKLLAPSTGCSAGGLTKTNEEPKYQALAAAVKSDSSDRIPHFTVRDVRDKTKLQAPIHQVRDVRKLVKSSYHFVSMDNNSADMEHKTSSQKGYQNSTSLPPIVIKCHSVNTNSIAKESERISDSSNHKLVDDIQEAEGTHSQESVDGITTGSEQTGNPTEQVQLTSIKQEGIPELRTETKNSTRRQETMCDTGEKKADPKMVALEKLQAAVKTMEQLYVFDKNEWKRKSKPQPITDSHVLSFLSTEHHGCNEQDQGNTSSLSVTTREDSVSNPDKLVTTGQQSTRKEEMEPFKISQTPVINDKQKDTKTLIHLDGTLNKKISSLSHSQKSFVPVTTSSVKAPEMHGSSAASISTIAVKNLKSPKQPVSLNISQSKPVTEKRENLSSNESKSNKAGFAPVQFRSSVDSENYITIPVKPYATNAQQSHREHSSNTKSQGDSHQPHRHSSTVMETRSPDTPTATIYHHPLPIMHAAQPQVICFSPTVQPSPVPTDHFQSTQKKMLLDPTTGNYYLVDTPVQPATRRLYDPETGQYVDVPMPQPPPMTPVSVPVSPLALSPGGYGHTYMFYPGYMASTVIPARTIQPQLSVQSEVESGDKSHAGQQGDEAYMESPYYMPSGKSLQLTPGAHHVPTGRVANSKIPVISITSQQGPRIIAPPSFDGTTMSFVVEHR